jgi:hypothetical protein
MIQYYEILGHTSIFKQEGRMEEKKKIEIKVRKLEKVETTAAVGGRAPGINGYGAIS